MDKIVFHRLSLNVTMRCTLNCELCCAYAPYLPSPKPHYDIDYLKKCVQEIFNLIDAIDVFTVTGGEPLLNRNTADIIRFIGKYRDRIGRLEMITNGTIVPDSNTVSALRTAKVNVLLDDYGKSLSKKVDEAEKCLKENNIEYRRRGNNADSAHCDGWVDFINLKRTSPRSEQQSRDLFKRCIQANELRCHPVNNGKIYLCSTHHYMMTTGKIEEKPSLYIDLFDNESSIETRRQRVRDYLNIEYLPSCAYCNGFLPDSPRYTPGKQLEI